MELSPATSPQKKVRTLSQDIVSNPKTSITCSNVPDELFDSTAAKKHFSKFGKVQKIRLCPKRQMCIVDYDQPSMAERAILNAGAYDGFMFDVTRTKARARRRSKKDDDPDWVPDSDVEEELSAMGGAPTYRVSRQKSMEVQPESPVPSKLKSPSKLARVMKHTPLKKKLPVRVKKPIVAQPTTTFEPPVIVATQTTLSTSEAALELHQLRNKISTVPDEQWRILDARDRVLRAWGGAGSRIKVGGATIGTCQDMCPEKELLHRQAEHQVMTLETVLESDGELEPRRAVKQYSRSSADQEFPMCYELRPPAALLRTCAYLLHEIADTKRQVSLADWFHFMWDRFRGIRKDITQQALCCAASIRLVEQCARFHAHCAARLADLEHTQFDQKLNTDNLTKCLQTLKHMYADVDAGQKPREPEFRGYIALLNLGDANFWWEIKQLPQEIQKAPEIAFAMKVFNALDNNNYVRFFRLVREEATYLQACILLRYFNDVRARALARIVKAYAPRGGSRFPAEEIMTSLAFESIESLKSFINHYGLRFARTEDSEVSVILDRNMFIEDSDPYPTARAIILIESKRNCSVGEIIAGGKLPDADYSQHVLYTSFTPDGRLKDAALTAGDQGYDTRNDSDKDVQALKSEIQRLSQGGKFQITGRATETKSNVFVKPDPKTAAMFSAPTLPLRNSKTFSFKPAIPVAPTEIIKDPPEKIFSPENKKIFSFSTPQETEVPNLFTGKNKVKGLFEVSKPTDSNSIFANVNKDKMAARTLFPNAKSDDVFKKPDGQSLFAQPSQPTQDLSRNLFSTPKNVFSDKAEKIATNEGNYTNNNIFSSAKSNAFSKPDDAAKFETGANIFGKQAPAEDIEPKSSNIFGTINKPKLSANIFTKPGTESANLFAKPVAESSNLFSKSGHESTNLFVKPSTDNSNIFTKPTGETSYVFSKPGPESSTGLFAKPNTESSGLFTKPKTDSTDLFTKPNTGSTNLFTKVNTDNAGLFTKPSTEKAGLFTKSGSVNPGLFTKTSTENAGLFNKPSTENAGLFTKPSIANAGLFTQPITENAGLFTKPSTENTGLLTKPITENTGLFVKPVTESANLFSQPGSAGNLFKPPSIFANGDVTSDNTSPKSLFKSVISDQNGTDGKGYTIFQSKNKAQSVADTILSSVNSGQGAIYEFNQNEEEQRLAELQRQNEERIKEEERKLQEKIRREEEQRAEELRRQEEERRKEEARRKKEELRLQEEKRRKEEERKQEELKRRLEEERKAELKRKADEERKFKERVDKESSELVEELVDEIENDAVTSIMKEELLNFNNLIQFATTVSEEMLTDLCNEISASEMKAEQFLTQKLMKKWFLLWRKQYVRNVKRRKLLEDTPVWLTRNTPLEEASYLRRFVENATLKNMNAIHRGYKFSGELKQLPTPEPYNIMEIIRSPLLKRMKQIHYPYDKCFFWKVTLVSPGTSDWLCRKINLKKWLLDVFSDRKKHDVSETLIHVGKHSWNHLMDFAISVSLSTADVHFKNSEAMEGANAILYYANENEHNLAEIIENTLKHKYPHQIIPVGVIIPKMENVSVQLRVESVLADLVQRNKILAYRIFVVDSQDCFQSLNTNTKSALKWLARKFPPTPPLEIDQLKSICQRYLGNEIWCRFRSENDIRMHVILKDLYKLIQCYNIAVDKLTNTITNEDLFNYPSFPLEFQSYLDSASPYPKPYEFIPSSVKNSENVSAIRRIMNQLKLPDPLSVFDPVNALSMQQQISKYCNQIGWFENPEVVACKVVAVLPSELSNVSMPTGDFIEYLAQYNLVDFMNIIVYEKINRLNTFENRFAIYEKSALENYRSVLWVHETSLINEIKHRAWEYDDDVDYYIDAKRRKIAVDSMEILMLEDKDRTLVEENIKANDESISKINNCAEAVKQLEQQLDEKMQKSLELENLLKAALIDL